MAVDNCEVMVIITAELRLLVDRRRVRRNWCGRVVQRVGILCRLRLQSTRTGKCPSAAVAEEPFTNNTRKTHTTTTYNGCRP